MSFADRFSLRDAPAPDGALEISAHQVSAARLETRGGRPVLAAHASEPLPAGAVAPSLTAHNVHDRPTVAAIVARVLERIGRPRRLGLVVPDAVARVSLLRFEQVPSRAQDLEQLVHWQVRKAAPFPIEEAQVSYVRGSRIAEGQEFLVVMARRAVVEEYESLTAAAGAHAGLVDISTLNVVNAVLAGSAAPPGDWMLVNVAADSASIAILRGAHPIYFRSRSADADGTLADVVHQSAMYYEDRLQGAGFARILLCGASRSAADQAPDAAETIRRELEERLGRGVEPADPLAAVALTDRISVAGPLLDTLAPLVGVLLRGRARDEGAAA
jgi:type IV pilus assembly protein PilM